MKYTGHMGKRNYHSLEECQGVLTDFARKYNKQWVHSGINNITPLARFSGADAAICKARRQVMAKARQQHPERWICGRMRNYEPAGSQWLNPDRAGVGNGFSHLEKWPLASAQSHPYSRLRSSGSLPVPHGRSTRNTGQGTSYSCLKNILG